MNASLFEKRDIDGDAFLYLEPSGRYYEEDVWGFRITEPNLRTQQDLVLEVTFWDRGYGLIEARRLVDPSFNGQYVGPSRSASYARVNSEGLRTAAFLFDRGPKGDGASDKADFALTGVQHLKSVRLIRAPDETYWAQRASEIPKDVQPCVSLRRPVDLVCSAGIEVL